MPLLPVEQIEQLAPVFKGKFGNTVAGFLRKVLSIKTLSDIYDTIDEYQGADFAGALLDKLGVNYLLGGSQRLANLPAIMCLSSCSASIRTATRDNAQICSNERSVSMQSDTAL